LAARQIERRAGGQGRQPVLLALGPVPCGVVVAGDRDTGGARFEGREDSVAADIAGMHDQLARGHDLRDTRIQVAMGVGEKSHLHRAFSRGLFRAHPDGTGSRLA